MPATVEQVSAGVQIVDFAFRYLLAPVITTIIGGVFVYKRAQKKFEKRLDQRLFDNMQRPVALWASKQDPMTVEQQLLNRIDFFEVHALAIDRRSLDALTDNYRLVILRYSHDKDFKHIFKTIASKQIPVIIYATAGEIPRNEMEEIHSTTTLYTLCNTPVRLVADVFAIMSVYPDVTRTKLKRHGS